MRAVLLTAQGIEHRHVVHALITALGDQAVGLVLESRPGTTLRSALRRYPPARVAERLATKAVRRILRHDARRAAALSAILGPLPGVPNTLRLHFTPSVNDAKTRAVILELGATHLFVFGTGIVRDSTLALGTALNLHTGWSPDYRGSDTEFWPIYEGRPHLLGVTVHACTSNIDGGPIYARAPVQWKAGDDAFVAFARSIQVGARLYADVARQLADGAAIVPTPQDPAIGRVYRFTDRTALHDLRMEFRR